MTLKRRGWVKCRCGSECSGAGGMCGANGVAEGMRMLGCEVR